MPAPAGDASAAEVRPAKGAAAEVCATHGAADVSAAAEMTATAKMAATAAAPMAAATAASSCQCVGRNGGSSQRRRNGDDRHLIQHRSHHDSCLSVRR
jgi:hypothetical protein